MGQQDAQKQIVTQRVDKLENANNEDIESDHIKESEISTSVQLIFSSF